MAKNRNLYEQSSESLSKGGGEWREKLGEGGGGKKRTRGDTKFFTYFGLAKEEGKGLRERGGKKMKPGMNSPLKQPWKQVTRRMKKKEGGGEFSPPPT